MITSNGPGYINTFNLSDATLTINTGAKYVGIGVSSPQYTLDVNGIIRADGSQLSNIPIGAIQGSIIAADTSTLAGIISSGLSSVALFTSNTSNYYKNVLQDWSTPIVSTTIGLGNIYLSTGGTGSGDVTSAQLTSTTRGLGQIYLSTSAGAIGTGTGVSSLFGVVSTGLSTTALFTSNTSNYYKNLLQDYSTAVSTTSLFTSNTSNYYANTLGVNVSSGFSTLGLFTSNTSNYYANTIRINISSGFSTLGLFTSNTSNYAKGALQDWSTGLSTVALFTSNTSNYFLQNAGGTGVSSLFGVVSSGLSTTALFTSNTSNYYSNLLQDWSTAISSVSTSYAISFMTSSVITSSITFGTGDGYLVFSDLQTSTISSVISYSGLYVGNGASLYNILMPSSVITAMRSTTDGLGQIYLSTGGGGGGGITSNNLISTVEGLGQIYISTAGGVTSNQLISTTVGLGNIYLSTTAGSIGSGEGVSSLYGVVSTGLSTTALFTSNTSNYYKNLLQDFSTPTSNTSNYYKNLLQDFSTPLSTVALFTSNTSNYFLQNAGGTGVSSLYGVVSSGLSTVGLFTSNTSNYYKNLLQDFSTAVSTVALFTSNTSNYYGNLLQDWSTSISSVSTSYAISFMTSSLITSSLTFGTGDGYLVFGDIQASSISTLASVSGNFIGDGRNLYNILMPSSVITAMRSTTDGLGQIYLSTGGGGGGITSNNLISTVEGLGQIYISTAGGGGTVTSNNLISTTEGLGQIYLSSLAELLRTSTLIVSTVYINMNPEDAPFWKSEAPILGSDPEPAPLALDVFGSARILKNLYVGSTTTVLTTSGIATNYLSTMKLQASSLTFYDSITMAKYDMNIQNGLLNMGNIIIANPTINGISSGLSSVALFTSNTSNYFLNNAGGPGTSSLYGVVSTGLSTTALFTSNTSNYFAALVQNFYIGNFTINISSGFSTLGLFTSNTSNYAKNLLQDYSTAVSTVALFTSNTSNYYANTLGVNISSGFSTLGLFTSNTSNYYNTGNFGINISSGFSTLGLFTSNVASNSMASSNWSRNLLQDWSTGQSTVALFTSNTNSNIVSTTIGLGTATYISSLQLTSTTRGLEEFVSTSIQAIPFVYAGATLYLNYSQTAGTYKALQSVLLNSAGESNITSLAAGGVLSNVFSVGFQSDFSLPKNIPGGIWNMALFCQANGTEVYTYVNLYNRDSLGTETLIVSLSNVPQLVPQVKTQVFIPIPVPSTSLPTGNVIVLKIFVNKNIAAARTFTTYFEDSAYSYVQTTFGVIYDDPVLQSTITGLGTFGYISTAQYNLLSNYYKPLLSNNYSTNLSTLGLFTSNTSNYYNNLLQDWSTSMSSVSTSYSQSFITSSLITSSITFGTGDGYLAFGDIQVSSLSSLAVISGNFIGDGRNLYNILMPSSVITALTSTVDNLGQIYISTAGGGGTVTSNNLISTVEGLGQIYISTAGGVTSNNLMSTTEGLGQIYLSSLAELLRTSTLIVSTVYINMNPEDAPFWRSGAPILGSDPEPDPLALDVFGSARILKNLYVGSTTTVIGTSGISVNALSTMKLQTSSLTFYDSITMTKYDMNIQNGLLNMGNVSIANPVLSGISSGLSTIALFTSNTSNYFLQNAGGTGVSSLYGVVSTGLSTVALFTSNTSNYFLNNAGGTGVSSLFGVVSTGLSTVALFTSNTSNYYANLLQDFSTPTSNTSNYYKNLLQDFSTPTSNTSNYYKNLLQDFSTPTSNTSNYYKNLLQDFSTGLSTIALFTSNTSNYYENLLQDFSTPTSNTSNYYANLLQDWSTSISSVSTSYSEMFMTSSLMTSSITFGTGDGYLVFGDLQVSSLSSIAVISGNFIGDGANIYNILVPSSVVTALMSTVDNLGQIYISTGGGGGGGLTTSELVSTVDNLGQIYISSPLYDYQIASTLYQSQEFSNVRLGTFAGYTGQTLRGVAIGYQAGSNTQGAEAVAIGSYAGNDTQQGSAIAIGTSAGYTSQGNSAIALGVASGNTSQGLSAIAIGTYAGSSGQGNSAVSIGDNAGQTTQGINSVGIGGYAGNDHQGENSIGIGYLAGQIYQNSNSVAIGNLAGRIAQGESAVSIGNNAGNDIQGSAAVAIGKYAGSNTQGLASIAIGNNAGNYIQGDGAIAIGQGAGELNQPPSSIVISGLTSTLNVLNQGFYVAPVRHIEGEQTHFLSYNARTAEVGTMANFVSSGFSTIALFTSNTSNYFAANPPASFNSAYVSSLIVSSMSYVNVNPAFSTVLIGIPATATAMLYSVDQGKTWAPTNGTFNQNGQGVAYNGSMWVAIGNDSLNVAKKIQYSYDGMNWYPSISGNFLYYGNSPYGIAWNGRIWVAIGRDDPNNLQNAIRYSSDGKNWTPSSAAGAKFTTFGGFGVAWNGRMWVACGSGGYTASILYSYDGITWVASSSGGFSDNGYTVAWNGRMWVAVGRTIYTTNPPIQYSYDGINWLTNTTGYFASVSGSYTGWGVAWNGRMWVAVGADNTTAATIKYSFDGINWSNSVTGGFTNTINGGKYVLWTGNVWIATGSHATVPACNVQWSSDGVNWTGTTSGITTGMFGIGFSSNLTPSFSQSNLNIVQYGNPLYLNSTNTIVPMTSSLYINDTMVIDRTWNYVGINCNVPGVALDVGGAGRFSSLSTFQVQTSNIFVAGNVSTLTLQTSNITAMGRVSTVILETSNITAMGRVSTVILQTSNITAMGLVSTVTLQTSNITAMGRVSTVTLQTSNITAMGRVGVFSNVPRYTLDVNGSGCFSSLTITGGTVLASTNTAFGLVLWHAGAAKLATTTWTQLSDSNLKEDIQYADYTICYNDIKGIPLRRYTYISTLLEKYEFKDKHVLGFLAQEVSSIQPKSVTINPILDTDAMWLNIDQLNMSLYGAVKKTMVDKEALESTTTSLYSRIESLEYTNYFLEGRLSTLEAYLPKLNNA